MARVLVIPLALALLGGFWACKDYTSADAPVPEVPSRPLTDAEAPVVVVPNEAGTCPTSYTRTGATCTFQSPFSDPSFQGTPPNAWTVGAGAQIVTSQNGPVDPGVARLRDANAVPFPFGNVGQSITMPGRAESEALAIEVVASSSVQFAAGFFPVDVYVGGRAVSEWFGGTFEAATADVGHTLHRCLGEAAYGGTIPVSFIALADGVPRLAVDKVTIVPDATCPLPGTVVNGDFEAGGGWKTSATGATIAGGLGKGGSRGARLSAVGFASPGGSITGTMSIPATRGAALKLTSGGNGGLTFKLDERTFERIRGGGGAFGADAGPPLERIVCLPTWSRGTVVNLGIQLDSSSIFFGSKLSTIDDIGIVDDPACVDPTNGGFEVEGDPFAAWLVKFGGPVTTTRTTTNPHSGVAALEMTSSECAAGNTTSSTAAVEQVFSLPSSTVATGGPAISYFYRYAAGTGVSARVLDPVDAGGGIFSPLVPVVPAAEAWTKRVVCMKPRPGGTRVTVRVEMSTFGECKPATLAVDDVVVGNDAKCPIE